MVNELLTDRDDGAHHGVPAAAKFACHIRYSPSVAADMQRRPTSTNARPESSTLTTPTRFRDRRRTSSSRRLCSASVACATPIWSAARTLAGIGCIGVRAGRLAFCFGAATSRLRVMPIRVDSSWRPPKILRPQTTPHMFANFVGPSATDVPGAADRGTVVGA
jgi:hypothetical protein